MSCVLCRTFVKNSRCPLVFIMSDSVSGDSSSRSLFPKDLQEELNITNIRFGLKYNIIMSGT